MRAKMQNTRFTLLNKLQAKLGDAVTITDEGDFYAVDINLGTGWASSYEGGYWGDCEIENDELNLHTIYGNIYDDEEVAFGEGSVQLKYKGGTEVNGLAYTGALDKMIGDKLEELTGGLITCSGSEQGMQGHDGDDESYLSVDMEECSIEETVAA
tara:strand:+ start:383 stop:847 length:465 start_codon:yes stop_codon:yes gene_type:complete